MGFWESAHMKGCKKPTWGRRGASICTTPGGGESGWGRRLGGWRGWRGAFQRQSGLGLLPQQSTHVFFVTRAHLVFCSNLAYAKSALVREAINITSQECCPVSLLMWGHTDCHEFMFSIGGIVISVSNVTSLWDCQIVQKSQKCPNIVQIEQKSKLSTTKKYKHCQNFKKKIKIVKIVNKNIKIVKTFNNCQFY